MVRTMLAPHHLLTLSLALFAGASTLAQPESVIRDNIGRQIASGQRWSAESRMVTPALQVEDTRRELTALVHSPARGQLLQQFADGTLLVWELRRGALTATLKVPRGSQPLLFDADRESLLVFGQGRFDWISRDGGVTSLQVSGLAVESSMITAATAAGDGALVWAGTRDGQVVLIAHDGTLLRRQQVSGGAIKALAALKAASVVTMTDEGDVFLVDGGAVKLASNVAALGGSRADGSHLLLMRDGVIRSVDSAGGAANLPKVPSNAGSPRQLAASSDGRSVAVLTQTGRLLVLHDGRWQEVASAGVGAVVFMQDDRYLYARRDGVSYLRTPALPHFLLSIVPAAQGWVVVDHEGRYDGTVAGARDVSWQAGADKLSLDQFFEDYFHPGLMARYLSRDARGAPPPVAAHVGDRVFLPPTVSIDLPDGPMQPSRTARAVVVTESRGGDIRNDVRLFHNGKRLPAKSRVGSQRVDRDGKLLVADVFEFTPTAGANELFAEARNVHGLTGRSTPMRQVTAGYRSTGQLHLVGVAIDRYRENSINLDYAKADVRALLEATNRSAAGTYKEVRSETLTDERATRGAVLKLLSSMQRLRSEDALVIMLAGHGVLVGDEWYFLPHDVDTSDPKRAGISARELQDALIETPVSQIFLLIDACNSGASVDSFNQYREFQRRFAQLISRTAGISVLTATRREQAAIELRSLGHGLFSHIVLQGLSGEADFQPKDGTITAHEIAAFVGDRFESVAGQIAARSPAGRMPTTIQSPTYFVIGSDFPLGAVQR